MQRPVIQEHLDHVIFHYMALPRIDEIGKIGKLFCSNYVDRNFKFLSYGFKNVQKRKQFLSESHQNPANLVGYNLTLKFELIYKALVDSGNAFVAIGIVDYFLQRIEDIVYQEKKMISVSSFQDSTLFKKYILNAQYLEYYVHNFVEEKLQRRVKNAFWIEEMEAKSVVLDVNVDQRVYVDERSRLLKQFECLDLLFFFKKSDFFSRNRGGFYEYLHFVHEQHINSQ